MEGVVVVVRNPEGSRNGEIRSLSDGAEAVEGVVVVVRNPEGSRNGEKRSLPDGGGLSCRRIDGKE